MYIILALKKVPVAEIYGEMAPLDYMLQCGLAIISRDGAANKEFQKGRRLF